jgi:hypothetical protein
MPDNNTTSTNPQPDEQSQKLDTILKILNSKQAPAFVGQPVYETDLDWLKMAGISHPKDIFGQKIDEQANEKALPINFGSKTETGHMPDNTRLRLFHLKKMIHNMEVQAQVMYRGQYITPDMLQQTPIFKQHLKPMLKAFNITDFSNWIPTVNARFYFEEYELPYLLANQFNQQPMDTASIEVPGDTGLLEGHEETDSATFTAQATAQAGYTVTARNNVVHASITQDLMSDSAPKYIDKLRKDLAIGNVRAFEKCLCIGDITQSGGVRGDAHQDTDIRALALNATFSKAFNGFRKIALANDAAIGAGKVVYDHGGDLPSKVMFEKLLTLMGKLASEKDDLIFLLGSSVENMLVTGAIPELFTAFAFGGLASNVTGQVPPVFGIKPITSAHNREDLNASAVYESGKTLTTVCLIKKSRFNIWLRQAMRMWAAPSLPSSDLMLMTSKIRHTFAGNPQSASEIAVTMAKNVATIL